MALGNEFVCQSLEYVERQLLHSLPDAKLIKAKPLAGGLSNRCWKLTLFHASIQQTRDYVWRPYSFAAQAFAVNRHQEYQLLTMIADSGLSPKPLALLPQQCHDDLMVSCSGLLVEWLKGKEADSQFSNQSLCQLQAYIHQLPVPSQRLDVQQRAEHYWQYITDERKTTTLTTIYEYFQQQSVPIFFADTCCHFDLGRYNIIVPFEGQNQCRDAKIIDWEYAGAGDPSLDLTMTILANELEPQQAIVDYCHQRQQLLPNTPIDIKQWQTAVNYWLPWCQYLALLWYLVGEQIWHQPYYREQADHLEKILLFWLYDNKNN